MLNQDIKLTKTFSLKDVLILALIVLVVLIVYLNTLKNPFLWDDEVIIVNNTLIKDWQNLPTIFKSTIFGAEANAKGFYRPLHTISYLIDYSFWELNPVGYHLSSIILHLFNIILIFLLLVKLGIKKNIAYLVGLIFGLHPINTEAVTFISARGDIIFTFFSLLCFLFFILGVKALHKRARYYLPAILFFIFALFSKESAIVLPFIILVYVFLFLGQKRIKEYWWPALTLCLISLTYIIVRLILLKSSQVVSLSLIAEASLGQRILTWPKIILTYFRQLIFPMNLHMEYLFVEKTWLSPYFYLGLPLIILMVYLILRYLKPFKNSLFFLSWFFIGLAPFYHWVAPLHATLLEHWLYFPMIGFLVIAVSLFFKFWEKIISSGNKILRIITIVLFIGLLIYYGAATVIRNQAWRDPLTLYLNDLKYEPQSFLLYNNLGVEYFRRGQVIEAKKAFLAAIEVSPGSGYSTAHNNLGVIYENQGQIDQAVAQYQKSISLNDYLLAYRNLGRTYLNQGQVERARAVLKQGLDFYPQDQELNEYWQALINLPVDK